MSGIFKCFWKFVIKIRVFSLNWAVQWKKKTLKRKRCHFFFPWKFIFPASQFKALDLNTFGDNLQNMKIVGCLRNIVHSSLTGNRGTLTLLCATAVDEIFWAAVTKMAVKLEVKLSLFQIRELSIFNVQHSKTTCCNEP